MPSQADRLIVDYARWIVRFRWPVLIVCVLAALAAAAGMRNLSFTSDCQLNGQSSARPLTPA